MKKLHDLAKSVSGCIDEKNNACKQYQFSEKNNSRIPGQNYTLGTGKNLIENMAAPIKIDGPNVLRSFSMTAHNLSKRAEVIDVNNLPPVVEEIKNALISLRNNKAQDVDGIPT